MNETDYKTFRVWMRSYILFLKELARVNKKRPINKPMAITELMDEVAHGRITMQITGDKKPLRVHGKID